MLVYQRVWKFGNVIERIIEACFGIFLRTPKREVMQPFQLVGRPIEPLKK